MSVQAPKNAGLTNNKKAKMIAAAMADNMDYIKASASYMKQSDFEGKKFGKSYTVYIPDPGKVVQGEVAEPDELEEVEAQVDLDNYNTSVTLSSWNRLGDIESFRDEIANPRAKKLARTEEKVIITQNCYKSAQAVVGDANFAILSDASAALRELAVAGDVVSFMSPTVMGKIANTGLANFIPNEAAKDLYSENYLGNYAGAAQVQAPLFPVLTTPASQTATITLTADGDGFKPITSITAGSSVTLKAGLAYKAAGLKVVDCSGMETDQDYIIIVQDASGTIPTLRITKEGKAAHNPNAWVPAGTTSLTLTPILANSTSYYVGQVRTKECLGYDSYKFDDLPGSENEGVGTVGGVTVKMSKYGDGNTLNKLVRLDAPYGAAIVEPRGSVTMYVRKG